MRFLQLPLGFYDRALLWARIGRVSLQKVIARDHKEPVQEGRSINAKSGKYDDALPVAISHGNAERVKILIDNGADVNAKDDLYGNVLQTAVSKGVVKVVKTLI